MSHLKSLRLLGALSVGMPIIGAAYACSGDRATGPSDTLSQAQVVALHDQLYAVQLGFHAVGDSAGRFHQTIPCPLSGTATVSGAAILGTGAAYDTLTYDACAMASFAVRGAVDEHFAITTAPGTPMSSTLTVSGNLTVTTSDMHTASCVISYVVSVNPNAVTGTYCGVVAATIIPT